MCLNTPLVYPSAGWWPVICPLFCVMRAEREAGPAAWCCPCVMQGSAHSTWHHHPSAKNHVPNIDMEIMEENRFLSLKSFKVHTKSVGFIFSRSVKWHCVIALVVSKLLQSLGGAYDGHYHYLGLIILPSTTRVFPGHVQKCCYVSQVILTYHLVIICQSITLD